MKFIKRFESNDWIEPNEFDESYKVISEQLFYELDDKFRIDPGVFFPIKLCLTERSDRYDLTIALGIGWMTRMSDDDLEWMSNRITDLNNDYSKNNNFWAAFMGDSFNSGRVVFEMMNDDFPRTSMDYMSHPVGRYPDRN